MRFGFTAICLAALLLPGCGQEKEGTSESSTAPRIGASAEPTRSEGGTAGGTRVTRTATSSAAPGSGLATTVSNGTTTSTATTSATAARPTGPTPEIQQVNPTEAEMGAPITLTIYGKNLKGARIAIRGEDGKDRDLKIGPTPTDTVITGSEIPYEQMEPGKYDVLVIGADGQAAALPGSLNLK
ncbi:MAG: hypothetical protein K1X53_04355 [Candidatus Sumerlaeaceae bacterium]|nr:hypothetical protein [Candidatus Sumerlaeaceae bacterium]